MFYRVNGVSVNFQLNISGRFQSFGKCFTGLMVNGAPASKIVSFKKWFKPSVDHCSPSDLSVQDSMYCDPV